MNLSREYFGVTPQLTVPDSDAAVAFYRDVLGAEVLARNETPDGRVAHCELSIRHGRLLLHDDFGGGTPLTHGGTAVALHAYVEDVDAVYARAGASGVEPPEDAFWGDRHAQFDDLAGHRWSIATPRERPTEDETG